MAGTVVMDALARVPLAHVPSGLAGPQPRSLRSDETASEPTWLVPERWSQPPALGAAPIVPCDEPEEDDQAVVLPAFRPAEPPAWSRREELPTFAAEIAQDPVVLPIGRARAKGDALRLALAAVLSLGALGASAAGLSLLL